MAPKKKAAEPAKPLPAQGKGQKRRTPRSNFDAAAGKMHDDLKKSAKDDTLEHSIIAAFNCD